MKDMTNRFYCFDRVQQRNLRNGERTSNRCFTNWEPEMKGQAITKRRTMTETECKAVRDLTGFAPYVQEKYV